MKRNFLSNDIAAQIKERLTAEEVARGYGFRPDRSGFIQCPFHKGDNHGSLKLYPGDRGWCCFGCRRGGSVINFVMELFGLNFSQAIIRLNSDFKLGLTASKPPPPQHSAALAERRRERREAERKREELLGLCREHRYYLECIKYMPPDGPDFIHPFYAEAVKRIDYLDYLTEEMMMDELGRAAGGTA